MIPPAATVYAAYVGEPNGPEISPETRRNKRVNVFNLNRSPISLDRVSPEPAIDCMNRELKQAFMSGDAELVKMILNHKSAEEDMLLSQSSLGKDKKDSQTTASTEENPTEGNSENNEPTAGPADKALGADSSDTHGGSKADNGEAQGGDGVSITHELGFGVKNSAVSNSTGIGVSFVVRELAIRNPDDCFGDDPTKDTTGLCLWGASVVLARWVASAELQKRLAGKSVLELGAGCGAG